MDISQASEIIEALANGINPVTGEVFLKDHCINEPDIIRALYIAAEELKKIEKDKIHKSSANAGKPWSKADDELLSKLFDEGKSTKELSEYFQRTRGSICSRLLKLEKRD